MDINGIEFTIGADPELFISKNNQPFSAFGLIEGTKTQPKIVNKGAVQVDGMALEFNIDPVKDKESFKDHILSVQETILSMVPSFNLIKTPTVFFDEDHMAQQPSEAIELGCDPDFNSRTMSANIKPFCAKPNMRTAGGHVHIGGFFSDNVYEPSHFDSCCALTNRMDEELGVYSILWDNDDLRRILYGKASCFRPKKYGMEYRTMSNQWIFNPKLIEIVFDFTMDAIKKAFTDEPFNEDVVEIINNSDRKSSFFKNNPKAERVMEAIA